MAPCPLVVIVGPTASGKTSLSIDLASRLNGEIISADSRAIYKCMDIGTAKPSQFEQQLVKHWGIDLVEPSERFTVADFKAYADHAVRDIQSRGKVPFLVGGTGLYIDAVVYDFKFGVEPSEPLRQKLLSMSVEELHSYCVRNNVSLPENLKNKRYLVRAIELSGQSVGRSKVPVGAVSIVGIKTTRDELIPRITERAEQIFDSKVADEAKRLGKKYGWTIDPMKSNIYPILHRYIDGEIGIEEAKSLFITRDWQLAKRQVTWFKRDSHIKWLELDEAREYIEGLLAPAH